MIKRILPEHPGIILKEEFIEALGLTAYAVSKETGISQTAVSEILRGKRGISVVNGLKLAKFFGMSDGYFINLQTKYDVDIAKDNTKDPLARIIPFRRKETDRLDLLEA